VRKKIIIFIASIIIFFAAHPNALNQNPLINKGDSLFALKQLEIIGLVILSSIMAIILYLINIIKTERLYKHIKKKISHPFNYVWVLLIDLFLTAFLCLFLIAVAPQIHYFYYQQIIPNLPNQIVFAAGLDVEKIIYFLVLPVESSIADYSTGFVFYLCLISTFLYALFRKNPK